MRTITIIHKTRKKEMMLIIIYLIVAYLPISWESEILDRSGLNDGDLVLSSFPSRPQRSGSPSFLPTEKPTSNIFNQKNIPSGFMNVPSSPTSLPSLFRRYEPSNHPVFRTNIPTTPEIEPTNLPSIAKLETTSSPSSLSKPPIEVPTSAPSSLPTSHPTSFPSSKVTPIPSSVSTTILTIESTFFPTNSSNRVTLRPTSELTSFPSQRIEPTGKPSSRSSRQSYLPTSRSSPVPSNLPTQAGTNSKEPSSFPSIKPTSFPSSIASNLPTSLVSPSAVPSNTPSLKPTDRTTQSPNTLTPTSFPSLYPNSETPTAQSSLISSENPSSSPSSSQPTIRTNNPTYSTTKSPSIGFPTSFPTSLLSEAPSSFPSRVPSLIPTQIPSSTPSRVPSLIPSRMPSSAPSPIPSSTPSSYPSSLPTTFPTGLPSSSPSSAPTPAGLVGKDWWYILVADFVIEFNSATAVNQNSLKTSLLQAFSSVLVNSSQTSITQITSNNSAHHRNAHSLSLVSGANLQKNSNYHLKVWYSSHKNVVKGNHMLLALTANATGFIAKLNPSYKIRNIFFASISSTTTAESPSKPSEPKKTFNILWFVIAVILLAGFWSGCYMYFKDSVYWSERNIAGCCSRTNNVFLNYWRDLEHRFHQALPQFDDDDEEDNYLPGGNSQRNPLFRSTRSYPDYQLSIHSDKSRFTNYLVDSDEDDDEDEEKLGSSHSSNSTTDLLPHSLKSTGVVEPSPKQTKNKSKEIELTTI